MMTFASSWKSAERKRSSICTKITVGSSQKATSCFTCVDYILMLVVNQELHL